MNHKMLYEKRASVILYYFLRSVREGVFLLPVNVCPIVVTTFMKAKRPFELLDISKKTLCLDEKTVLQKLKANSQKYAGVHFIRTYGLGGSFDNFFKQIKAINSKLTVIDDKCLCAPELDAPSDQVAELTLFSTGYSKYVDVGFGGFGWIKDDQAIKKSTVPFKKSDHDKLVNNFQLAIESGKLFRYDDLDWLDVLPPEPSFAEYKRQVSDRLKKARELKLKINKIYKTKLPKEIQLPAHSYEWRFNILVPNKEKLLKVIFDQGLFASSHYLPVNKIFSGLETESFPNAENLHKQVINLFNDFHFDTTKAMETTEIINANLDR